MTEEELKQIEARLNAATPGPWYWHEKFGACKKPRTPNECSLILSSDADHSVMINAPTDIRKLLDEVKNPNRYFKCDWCNKNGEDDIYPMQEHGGIDDAGAEICEGCRAGAVYGYEEA